MNKKMVLMALLLVSVAAAVFGTDFEERITEKKWYRDYFNEVIYRKDRNIIIEYQPKLTKKEQISFYDYAYDDMIFWFEEPPYYLDCIECYILRDGGYYLSIFTGEITNALKTEPGTAFFWSGCAKVDPSSGKLLVSGDEVAAEIANKCGGTTLETQIKVNNIEMPKWDFDVPESIKAWEDTSAAYAKQVSGDVRAIVGKKLRPENIWENVELPRLMQNPNVSKITTIDPDTMAETVIFERKAGTVYVKPNETLIKNGKWDEILESMKNDKSIGEIIDINSNKQIIIETSGIKGNWNKALNSELKPNKIYKVDDYSYFTDEAGRVNKVSGELKLETKDRNVYQQGKSVDIKGGIKGDDQGGHIIARVFNGPGEQINYVPQTAKLNNGEWKSMEKKWKDALSEGKKVEVDIQIIYNSDKSTKRPLGFFVEYKIDGIEQSPIYHYN